MRFNELNDDNYLLFAIKFYDNPHAVTREDFEDDLKKIKYVKRLLRRYLNTNVLKTHLILNHLTVLFNVFGDAAVPLLFFNLEKDLWSAIKSFLVFLGKLPEFPRSETIEDIPIDPYCLEQLENINESACVGALGAGGGQHKIYPGTLEANGQIAGLPPDEPPVDLRKRKHRKLNMFYRQAVKQSRKGAKNGRKRS